MESTYSIASVEKKVTQGCHALFKLRPISDVKILWKVYFSLVFPHLHYAILTWGKIPAKGVTRGATGRNSPGAESLWGPNQCGGAEWLRGEPRGTNNTRSTSFNTFNLLPKDRKLEHGGAKLISCPRCHLTSLCPWSLQRI